MNQNDFRGKLFLAPMAGYTDLPFRLLAREYGADVTISEMVSAKGIYYKDKKTARLLETVPQEQPFGIQLFGSEPEILAYAARHLCERNHNPEDPLCFDFIDFNAGCPAPKIVKNGDGSALIRSPQLFYQCIDSLVQNSSVPVSVKTRKGFLENENFSSKLAQISEEAGASAFTLHPRSRTAFYSGQADWDCIQEACEAVAIPVILSGDIKSVSDAEKALKTGASSLMIGRAAVSDPSIFQRIKENQHDNPEIDDLIRSRVEIALRHIHLIEAYTPSPYAFVEARKHLSAYTKGLPGSSKLRPEIFKIENAEQAKEILNSFI